MPASRHAARMSRSSMIEPPKPPFRRMRWSSALPLLVEVARRALLPPRVRRPALLLVEADPVGLGLRGDLEGRDAIVQGVADQLGEVGGHDVLGEREVVLPRGLARCRQHEVGEAVHVLAVQGGGPLLPLLGQRLTVAAGHRDRRAFLVRRQLEPGGEDQQVELELLAVGDDDVPADAVDASALGVDQGDVVLVERVEVLVVEARALAEPVVPRLERLGGLRVADHGLGPLADALHDLEVDHLQQVGHLLRRHVGLRVPLDPLRQLAPTVLDQIDGVEAPIVRDEVHHALLLPARRLRLEPLDIGGALARTSTDDGVRWKT